VEADVPGGGELRARIGAWGRWAVILGIFGLAVAALGAFATVEYTAQPAFCDNCHIMEPYYASWQGSAHAEVGCIECHYEPGSLETMEGKFKALSQLAKYVTRTQGTKPWAEVSDHSCMRSGCHTVRDLEGPIEFGRVRFDHRDHLLESRRGRRLRCTSCHSQVMQGEHIAVTESTCFTCHFMPDDHGEVPEATGDCLLCHGPPKEPVDVAGEPFVHAEYVERGVSCRECHDPVIDGDGQVRRERCHSCHGEEGHIEHIGDSVFMHATHVTEHKVECFECHDEIHHGLLPLEPPRPASKEGCGACHVDAHEAVRNVYSGTGARDVADRPSRMYVTRVVCAACHTGRAARTIEAAAHPHRDGHGAHVAAAGAVDCIHCHGTGFAPMLEEWQAAVGGELDRLGPLLEELEAEAAPDAGEPRELLAAARWNYEMIAFDGSRGAHNPNYALDVLADVAERLDRVAAIAEPGRELGAAAGVVLRSGERCDACHVAVAERDVQVHGRPFPHDRHLREAGLACADCHDPARHGEPAFPRERCASCHHDDAAETFDAGDCASCHALQAQVIEGGLEGFGAYATPMAEKECGDCHGEPPDILNPQPMLCALCHDEEYGEMLERWPPETEALLAELEAALAGATPAGPDARAAAERALRLVRADGSMGVHNHGLIQESLRAAIRGLGR
jgi:nitrate/TMAO reductase-like tetraheme cytochrome c subunit